jgi:AcrR family transcriptional regulator
MARTRSAQAHKKVLEASLKLFAERGIDATSMDSIAEVSGVSKATIYKHWHDKGQLALESLELLFGLHEEHPKFESGDLRKDFIDALTYQPTKERQEMKNRIMPHVIAYATRDKAFEATWRERVWSKSQNGVKEMLKRGMSEGTLVRDIDLEIATAQLLGPAFYWYMFHGRKSGKAMAREWASTIVNSFWEAYARKKH